jgi:class 3 adenylate cyclase
MAPDGQVLPKQSIITILRALGDYPEDPVFTVLNDYFFYPDVEVSVEAIRSSGHRANHNAVPHLLHLIEKGERVQILEALQALAVIHAPIALDSLLNYFAHYNDVELKRETLRTMNALIPFQEKILELNRGVLTHNCDDEELCRIAVHGLIESEDFSYLDYYLLHAPDSIQHEAFQTLFRSKSKRASSFLKKFENEAHNFSDNTKGAFLGAYYLKTQKPNASFTLKLLSHASKKVFLPYLQALSRCIEHSASPKNIFRFLLLLPFVDTEVEIEISELIKRILDLYRDRTPGTKSEFRSITSVHLDQLFRKVKERHISVRRVQKKEDFLPTLFAHLIEKYCSEQFVEEVLKYFRGQKTEDPSLLIEAMRECLVGGEQSDVRGFKACVPLFLETDAKQRLKIYTFVKRIDPQVTNMLRRLNRLIKAAGYLHIKTHAKLMQEIRAFAADEKIGYLEEAATITLCQIQPQSIAEVAKDVFANPGTNEDIIKSFVRGARYLPSSAIAEPLVDFIIGVGCPPALRQLALDSLECINLLDSPSANSKLIRSLDRSDIEESHKETMTGIVARYINSSTVQSVIDLLSSGGTYSKILGTRIVQQIEEGRNDLPAPVLTGKLYSLIEDNDRRLKAASLIALLSLKDDYAGKIAEDWLDSDDTMLIREVLLRFNGRPAMIESILPHVMKLLLYDDQEVQEALQELLSVLARSPSATEVRDALLEVLASPPEASPREMKRREDERIRSGDAFLHPKLEYKFRREHCQVLTVFFIDMVDYTSQASQSDVTNLMKLIRTFEDNVIPALERFKGHIVKKLGDGILAVFKHPVSATVAAMEVRRRIREYNRYAVDGDKFQVRMGLDTGEVIWKDNDVFGDIVNTASRMETSAEPGDIFITANVYGQVKDFVDCKGRDELQLKGKDGPVKVYVPVDVTKEVKAFLEIKKNNVQAAADAKGSIALSRLQEAFFNPRFDIPAGMAQGVKEPMQLVNMLHTLFSDMAEAASEITHDFREEYLFKQYLQDKWNATISNLKNLR